MRAISFSLPLLDNSMTVDGTGADKLAMGSLATGGTGWYPLAQGTLNTIKDFRMVEGIEFAFEGLDIGFTRVSKWLLVVSCVITLWIKDWCMACL